MMTKKDVLYRLYYQICSSLNQIQVKTAKNNAGPTEI